MSSWCAKQIGMPVRYCKNGVFRKSRSAWGGCARQWRSQITVCIGDSSRFPRSASSHWKDCVFADDVEALVAVTARELFHLEAGRIGSPNFQSTRGRHGHSSEAVPCKVEREVLETFRQQRQTLLSNWTQQTDMKNEPKNDKVDQAIAALTKWKRKLALAKTKVRKFEAKIKRLNKAQNKTCATNERALELTADPNVGSVRRD